MQIEKILIVEDDLITQIFISRTLSSNGYEITGESRSGEDAIESINVKKPDLVLMDIGIVGETDGVETAKIIVEKHDIPIVFITGNSDEVTINRAKKVNPLEIIYKPMDEMKLLSKIEEIKERNI